ncbi:MAG: alpha/beta hydrolase [Gammaproteobacteria bacterium]|nr:alpha/beta hydrolase [Gammaproteobacteria bacterium]MBI5616817.1 alpha/beta hydrolase [Gammaproteobacteria bacterium]
MASPQSDALNRLYDHFLAEIGARPEMSIEELRDLLDECAHVAREPGGVDYLEVDAAGTPCLWAVPKGAATDRVLFCTHGGGCVTGSRFSHRKLYAHLAKAVGCRALILDYRRAPEHTHPAQVNECVAVYRWLLAQGIKPEHVATTGDSAGGQLCTTVVLGARDAGLPLPAAVMPLSPWYDMEATGESIERNAAVDRLIKRPLIENMAGLFLGGHSPKDPLCNPLYADLAGFPPIYLQVGGYEALLDDSTRFAARAQAAGVNATCEVWPEMQHVFQFMAGNAPEADQAIAKLAAWVQPKLGLA